jgi:hypothetical protein
MKREIQKRSSNNILSNLLPVWNKPLLKPLPPGSRDPLGFQRYATLFSDHLLPNITVLTGRARYFSFLAWVLDELRDYVEPLYLVYEGLPFEKYSDLLARFERFLALAEAVWHEQNPSNNCHWVGERRARALARKGRNKLPMDVSLTIQEGSQGALADYRQSMLKLGLLSEHPTVLPDMLTESGQELADYFRYAVQTAKANRMSGICQDQGVFALDTSRLRDAGRWFCLSRISKEEHGLLHPLLLGGGHEPAVRELSPLLKRRRSASETEILDHYLILSVRNGTAFELKQIAVYQIFALACLSIFHFVYRSFDEVGQTHSLNEIIGSQLKQEKIQPGATVGSLTRRIQWDEERKTIIDNSSSPLIRPSLRLLYWVCRLTQEDPNLIFRETVESVSLAHISGLFAQPTRNVDELLFTLCEIFIENHQRVFVSKRKRPWLSLSGALVESTDHMVEPPLNYPPNSVRLSSLVSLYRDLEKHHV